jgi:hypothetical protein
MSSLLVATSPVSVSLYSFFNCMSEHPRLEGAGGYYNGVNTVVVTSLFLTVAVHHFGHTLL